MSAPIVPRDAATVMIVRDAPSIDSGTTLEVLMLRRNSRSGWVAGVHLFPGGAVDAEDGSAEIARYCTGPDDEEASRTLGVASGGRRFLVAAVRECFEEAGILLASRDGTPLSFADDEVASRFAHHRHCLNAGETGLVDICAAERLRLDLGSLVYFSHWITPEGSPRRYDTRFFVGVLPEGQEALHDDTEVVASTWIEPALAIERHLAGELDLWLPTMKNLEVVSRFATSAELMSAAATAAMVPVILPRISMEGEVAHLLLPGDEGYEEATGLALGVPFPDPPTQARRPSRSERPADAEPPTQAGDRG